VGLFFRLTVRRSASETVAEFLERSLGAHISELPVSSWSAVRFGTTSFGVFVESVDLEGQQAHIGDHVATVLRDQLGPLLTATPEVHGYDVLAGGVLTGAR
jgi:hypothetical protein